MATLVGGGLMRTSRVLVLLLKLTGLLVAFLFLFAAGAALLGPRDLPPPASGTPMGAALALLAVAAMDVPLLAALAVTSRLRGARLWMTLSCFQWFVMTVTSQLEAAYFMPNVRLSLVPALMGMTLPLCLFFPPLAMATFGLFRARPDLAPAWRSPAIGRGETAARIVVLAAIVYPFLFFPAGYFIAWQSPALRQFYSGSTELLPPVAHFARMIADDPLVYPFEVLRGALWVGAALLVLRTSDGPAWRSTALVALSFALLQNNLHLLPNPLMPAEVGRVHFLETASSNFAWGLAIGWVMTGPRLTAGRPARPSDR